MRVDGIILLTSCLPDRELVNLSRSAPVVGFDDLPSSAFTIPPLTTVHRSTGEIGEGAAEAVIDLVERRVPSSRVSAPTLAIRDSTRPLRSRASPRLPRRSIPCRRPPFDTTDGG